MTLLAPFALIGTLLLAIPILVHLFKPRKMRQTPFSSLRWLKQTHQRLSRRIQWHQWLLFLVRAACILLLVLALAKPLVGSRGAARPVDRFVIVDVSRSMAYQADEQPTPMDRARELGADMLQNMRPGDRAALLLAGGQTRLVTPLVPDASAHASTLKAAKPGLSDANLGSALPVIQSLLPKVAAERDLELVFLTDNLKSRWHPGDIQNFLKNVHAPLRVQVVDVGPGSARNAWIAEARLLPGGKGGDRVIRATAGCAGTAKLERSVRLAGITGLGDDSQPINLQPGQLARVDFKLPGDVNLQGQVAELRLEPADALPSDDVFFLNLDASLATKVLVVEPETQSADGRSAGLYLRAGVEALSAASNQSFELINRTSTAATAGDFQKADVIFLAGVPELTDSALESLEARVRSGAGLVVFLGPHIKTAFYNEKLHKPLQPSAGLLPLPLKTGVELLLQQGNPGQLTNIHWTHPLLAPLNDPVFGDLPQTQFRFYATFAGAAAKSDVVLARLDDEEPALLEHIVGSGRVLVFNTSAGDEWSDLPRKKSFVPLLDRVLSYLSAGVARRSFTVGDVITLPLADSPEGEQVSVLAPSGEKITPRLLGLRGQMFLHLDEVTEAGVYRVTRGGKSGADFAIVVNAGRGDSPLAAPDAKVLEDWWAPASFEILSGEAAAQRFAAPTSSPLWPALVLAAGLLLLAETVYVYRLCPRVNPKAADSVVHERGLLRPLEQNSV